MRSHNYEIVTHSEQVIFSISEYCDLWVILTIFDPAEAETAVTPPQLSNKLTYQKQKRSRSSVVFAHSWSSWIIRPLTVNMIYQVCFSSVVRAHSAVCISRKTLRLMFILCLALIHTPLLLLFCCSVPPPLPSRCPISASCLQPLWPLQHHPQMHIWPLICVFEYFAPKKLLNGLFPS